jgi:hypothetical protein
MSKNAEESKKKMISEFTWCFPGEESMKVNRRCDVCGGNAIITKINGKPFIKCMKKNCFEGV